MLRHERMTIAMVLSECCSFVPWSLSAARTKEEEKDKDQDKDSENR